MNAREDEIYKLAQLVWGESTGQCIVGKSIVSVYRISGDDSRPLFRIEHPEAYRLARMFLGRLAHMAARVVTPPPAPPAHVVTQAVGELVAAPPVDPDAPRAGE